MKLNKTIWQTCWLFTTAFTLMLQGAVAEITGSAHDFGEAVFADGEICVVCHTPHGTKGSSSGGPLWHHDLTRTTFTPYTSPTFEGSATAGQPSASSKLCLSCHDGTVAVDAFGGVSGTWFIGDSRLIGTDLRDDHPISFVYDSALASIDGGLFDPTTKVVTVGSGVYTEVSTIDDLLLFGGRLECGSCHDVHNDAVENPDEPLLRISIRGSKLCLSCHNK